MSGGLGRHTAGRASSPSGYCFSCKVRLTIGEPRHSLKWPERLRLDKQTWDAMLTAAVEYAELCAETGEPESAVSFADWLEGVSRHSRVLIEADGGRTRLEDGGFGRTYNHRHPDPLPRVALPPKIRGAA